MNNAVQVKNLEKSFNSLKVFTDLTFEAEGGKITAFFGPNGCGKSTLLNILAGIVSKDKGDYFIKDFNPHQFSYIFQNYRESLLPWKKNFDNIAFPLEIQKYSSKIIKSRVDEVQSFFEFHFDLEQYPYELSGGQQQILSFFRAFITKPKILFIDEPFSALDYENNIRLRKKLQEFYLKQKPTILLISHNIEEAVHLAHRIIVFSKKPTKVLDVIENTLPYPRTVESLKSEEFHRIKDKVLSVFQKAVNL